MVRVVCRLAAAVLAASLALPAIAATCPVKIGAVLPLTGPLAPVVGPMLISAQLAIDQINAAGGVLGCPAALVVRDSQTQPSLAVDAAHQLIDIEGVRVIVGEVTSGDTLAILNSVTVPAKVPLISPTASAPGFSQIGGHTGLFFRTNASDSLQGVAAASHAIDAKAGRVAVLAVNTDWGINLSNIFKTAYERLGGSVTKIVLYNPDQSSYRADNLNDAAFVKAVGANYLSHAVWLTPGTTDTPSLGNFRAAYTARTQKPAQGPGRTGMYDSVVLAALAIQAARTDQDGSAIAAGVRRATDPRAARIDAGEAGFRTALATLADGKPVNYVGATGPLQFDGNGDIAVPFVAWTLDAAGALQITGRMSAEDVAAMRQKVFVTN
jgi:branched-chain amino acid transport system substrate-binding protein